MVLIGKTNNGYDHNIIAYIKKMDNGTTFYLEEILDSNRNKALRSKTMHIHKNDISKDKFTNIVLHNNPEISESKIYGP